MVVVLPLVGIELAGFDLERRTLWVVEVFPVSGVLFQDEFVGVVHHDLSAGGDCCSDLAVRDACRVVLVVLDVGISRHGLLRQGPVFRRHACLLRGSHAKGVLAPRLDPEYFGIVAVD